MIRMYMERLQMQISSTKTEHRALNALESIIDDHSTMDYQFNGNDKEMSWDGFIWLYRINNGDQSKQNIEARIPVQIKGHNDSKHLFIGKKLIKYNVNLVDLESYATEKGVLYFQIFIDGKNREIFYSSLYPSKIADYLETAKEKGNTTYYKIPFVKLEKKPDKLYIITKQFNEEAKKQGTAYTSLVQDRIRSAELHKLKEINLSVVGASDFYSAFLRLRSGDICIYGKLEDDKYYRPIEWQDNAKFYAKRELNRFVAINGEIFYKKINIVINSDDCIEIVLSPNLIINLSEGVTILKVKSTIRELGYDAKFLLKLEEATAFEIEGYASEFRVSKLSPESKKRIQCIVDLFDTLQMIGFDLDTYYSYYTDKQKLQLSQLVDLRLGVYNDKLPGDICRYNWQIGDKYFPLLVIKEDDRIRLYNPVNNNEFSVYWVSEDDPMGKKYRMPLFIDYSVDVLSNLYQYDFDVYYQQINDSEINCITANILLERSLVLINVYDRILDVRFLELAKYILTKVEPYIEKEFYILNEMQIKIRRNELCDGDLRMIESIDSDEIHIQFGKNVILGDKKKAKALFDEFSEEEREIYKHYPIYTLYKQL